MNREEERIQSLLHYGLLLAEWGRPDEAREKVESCVQAARVIQAGKLESKAIRVLAELAYQRGEDQEAQYFAEAVLRHAADVPMEKGHAHYILGKLAQKDEKWLEAMEHLQQASEIFSSCRSVYRYLQASTSWAECTKRSGDIVKAVDILTQTHLTATHILNERGIVL
jgi:tetratricopeptide (TPR) repeat protein